MEDEEGALLGSITARRTSSQRARTRPERLPPVLTGHLLFCSLLAAVVVLAGSPVAKINQYTTAYAGIAMPVSMSSFHGRGIPAFLRVGRELGECIALPSIAGLWGCADLIREPSGRELQRQLAYLSLAWVMSGTASCIFRNLGVPGGLHYAFSGE